MSKQIRIIVMIFIAMSFYSIKGQNHAGLFIINETNRVVRVHITTANNEFRHNLRPQEQYLVSEQPLNLKVYTPNGASSHFYNIGMNTSVFDRLRIRIQRRNPTCAIIGYTGRTRQRNPVNVPPVAFEPNACYIRAWNPTTGTIYTQQPITEPPTPRSIQPGVITQ